MSLIDVTLTRGELCVVMCALAEAIAAAHESVLHGADALARDCARDNLSLFESLQRRLRTIEAAALARPPEIRRGPIAAAVHAAVACGSDNWFLYAKPEIRDPELRNQIASGGGVTADWHRMSMCTRYGRGWQA